MPDKRVRRKVPVLTGRQPHFHPQPGGLDKRGNCPACADFNPEKYGWADGRAE